MLKIAFAFEYKPYYKRLLLPKKRGRNQRKRRKTRKT